MDESRDNTGGDAADPWPARADVGDGSEACPPDHFKTPDSLAALYREAATDETREREALAWLEEAVDDGFV